MHRNTDILLYIIRLTYGFALTAELISLRLYGTYYVLQTCFLALSFCISLVLMLVLFLMMLSAFTGAMNKTVLCTSYG